MPQDVRKQATQDVKVGEDSATISLLEDAHTSHPIGVNLKVMFGPNAIMPKDFFANGTDSWNSFYQAELRPADSGKLILVVGDEEKGQQTLSILRSLLMAWPSKPDSNSAHGV